MPTLARRPAREMSRHSPVGTATDLPPKEAVSMKHRTCAALILAAVLGVSSCTDGAGRAGTDSDHDIATPTSDGTPTLDRSAMPPWPVPNDVAPHVEAAGLDLGPMGTVEHYHPRLRILIGGVRVPIPANIGVDPTTGAMSALHTHEGDGTIHVEAHSAGEVFTLGQLFTQWGVALTPRRIGGARAEPGQEVRVLSKGARVGGDPAELRLEPGQQILLKLD